MEATVLLLFSGLITQLHALCGDRYPDCHKWKSMCDTLWHRGNCPTTCGSCDELLENLKHMTTSRRTNSPCEDSSRRCSQLKNMCHTLAIQVLCGWTCGSCTLITSTYTVSTTTEYSPCMDLNTECSEVADLCGLIAVQAVCGKTCGFCTTTQVPTTAVTTPIVKPGELLKVMQPANPSCYLQHGAPIDALKVFHPAIFDTDYSNPVCVCEQWWPTGDPQQLIIAAGEATGKWGTEPAENLCLPAKENVVGCESFSEDRRCVAHLQIGEWAEPVEKLYSYVKDALLKCTKLSSIDAKTVPAFPVEIYEISKFDIGKRCNPTAIKNKLHERLEHYRKNSQFFYQIPIFGSDDFLEFCDPRIAEKGASIKIYFKCSWLPPVVTPHVVPEARPQKPSSLVNRYVIMGTPPVNLLLQGPYTKPPTKDEPLCVLEENGIIKNQPDVKIEDCDQTTDGHSFL